MLFDFLCRVDKALHLQEGFPVVYIDMDGVIVDFVGYMQVNDLTADQVKYEAGHYRNMRPVEGALDAVRKLILMGFDVRIATKPPSNNASAYMEKAEWVFKEIPELSNAITITHDKGQLGSFYDYLIDDRPHKANCSNFAGELIVFDINNDNEWGRIISYFESIVCKARD